MTENYVFTRSQLDALLSSVFDLFTEYATKHRPDGMDDDELTAYAQFSAVRDTLEGLDAEAELLAHGENLTPTHLRLDPAETIDGLRALRNRLQNYLRELDPEGCFYLVLTEASDLIHVDMMDTTHEHERIETLLYAPTVAALVGQEVQIRNLIAGHVDEHSEDDEEE